MNEKIKEGEQMFRLWKDTKRSKQIEAVLVSSKQTRKKN